MSRDRRPPLPKLHVIDDVAEILGLSTRTVRRMIAKRELPAVHLGRSVRVHPDDLADYIDRHRGRCPRLATRVVSSHHQE
jgi:excisionase family DNA binding protein